MVFQIGAHKALIVKKIPPESHHIGNMHSITPLGYTLRNKLSLVIQEGENEGEG